MSDWVNYHHLLYFWTVAKEGSIARASQTLRLAQPTISLQIRSLENALEHKLFRKSGRNLVLTDTGRVVYGYANDIFELGREMSDVLRGRLSGKPMRLVVGVTDVLPKVIAYDLLRPAVRMAEPVRLECHEGRPEELMRMLAAHRLDLVLSDAPVPPAEDVKAFHHLLGTSSICFVGEKRLAAKLRSNFPQSLDGAPMLLPMANSSLRRSLEHWFDSVHVTPNIMGEFADSALLKVFGQAGYGVFAAPAVIVEDVRKFYSVQEIGRVDAIVENFYAISMERRIKHPAVIAISEGARELLFAKKASSASARPARV